MNHTFQVKAKENSLGNGKPLNTEIELMPGDLIIVNVSPDNKWRAGAADRESNANGLSNPLGGNYGFHAKGDYKFLFGSLIGTLDGGKTFFPVGTALTMTILSRGTLSFVYWDVNNADNSGEVTVSVQVFKGPQM